MKKIFKIAIIVMSLFLLAACGKSDNKKEAKEAEKLSLDKLNVTYVTSPLNVPSIVEKELGIFEKNMPGVKVNYSEITSGADQTQALAAGDVDVLYALGGSSAILAKANGVDLKVLNMYSRAPEAFGLYSMDKSLNSPESLKGKKIAGPAGTNLHELLIAYLKKANMTIDDVEYVNMSIPDAAAALESGAIDVAMLGGPAGYKAVKSGKNEITNGKGLIDAIICVATSEKFYNEHKDVIDKLMEAQKETADYMKNNSEETRDIVMKALSLDQEAFDTMYKMYDFSTEITDADKEGFKRTKDFMLETKMIDKDIDIDSLFIK